MSEPAVRLKTVKARVRGTSQVIEVAALDAEECWHCGGEGVCACALCTGIAGKPEACGACFRTGYLTWPEGNEHQ